MPCHNLATEHLAGSWLGGKKMANSVVKKKAGRLTIQLNQHIALEALILRRLDRLPRSRHQEWLRGLLVQGLRIECQLMRNISDSEANQPEATFSTWLSASSQKSSTGQGRPPTENPALVKAQGTDKPFARLRGVIG